MSKLSRKSFNHRAWCESHLDAAIELFFACPHRVILMYDKSDMPLVVGKNKHQVIVHKGYDLWRGSTSDAFNMHLVKAEASFEEALDWLK